jgi:hypothetical protein
MPMYLIEHYTMKTHVSSGIAPHVPNLNTRLSYWSASQPSHFPPPPSQQGASFMQ